MRIKFKRSYLYAPKGGVRAVPVEAELAVLTRDDEHPQLPPSYLFVGDFWQLRNAISAGVQGGMEETVYQAYEKLPKQWQVWAK